MKKLIFPLCFLLAFSACKPNGGGDDPVVGKDKVSFTSTVEDYTSKAGDLYFESGDAISAFAYADDASYADNVKYTFSGDKFSSQTPIEYKNDEQKLAFYAVYPYAADIAESFSFEAAADQSTEASYLASDLMRAETEELHSVTPELPFYHKFAKVVLEIESSDVETEDAKVTFSAKNAADCNFVENTVAAKGDNVDIKALAVSDEEFAAIVAPQTFANAEVLVTIEVDGDTYTWTPEADVELASGKMYVCKLSIYKDAVTFEGQIEEWSDGGELGGDPGINDEIDEFSMSLVEVTTKDIIVNVDRGDYDANYYVGLVEGGVTEENAYDAAVSLLYDEIYRYGTDLSIVDDICVFDEDKKDISLGDTWYPRFGETYTVISMCIKDDGRIVSNVAHQEVILKDVVVAGSIGVEVLSTTQEDIVIKATPSADVENYTMAAISTDEYMTLFGGDYSRVAASVVYTLQENNIDFTKPDDYIVFNGEAEISVGDPWTLEASTNYSIFVFAVDADGNVVSDITVQEARTADIDFGNIDGTLEVEIVQASNFDLVVDVEATGNTGYFYVGPYLKADFDAEFDGDTVALANAIVKHEMEAYGTNFGKKDDMYVFGNSISNLSMGGRLAWTFAPDFDYMILAFGVSPSGEITTNISVDEAFTGYVDNTSEGSAEYNAFIGDWTMTAFDSYKGGVITYDVKIEKYGVDESFLLTGWGSQVTRNIPIIVRYTVLDGLPMFTIRGTQPIANDGDPDKDYRVVSIGTLGENPDPYEQSIINLEYDAVDAMLQDDGSLWVITTMGNIGGLFDVMYTTVYEQAADGTLICPPFAEGYDDNPLRPFQMIKKGSEQEAAPISVFEQTHASQFIKQAAYLNRPKNENMHSAHRLKPIAEKAVEARAKMTVSTENLSKREIISVK